MADLPAFFMVALPAFFMAGRNLGLLFGFPHLTARPTNVGGQESRLPDGFGFFNADAILIQSLGIGWSKSSGLVRTVFSGDILAYLLAAVRSDVDLGESNGFGRSRVGVGELRHLVVAFFAGVVCDIPIVLENLVCRSLS